jgi:hypothetical protein
LVQKPFFTVCDLVLEFIMVLMQKYTNLRTARTETQRAETNIQTASSNPQQTQSTLQLRIAKAQITAMPLNNLTINKGPIVFSKH